MVVRKNKIHIQLDKQFYITSNTYNRAILVQTALPASDIDPSNIDYRDLTRRKQWYFSNFELAIQTYARQKALLDGDNGQEITSLKQLARVIDENLGIADEQVKKQLPDQPAVSDDSDDTDKSDEDDVDSDHDTSVGTDD